MTPFNTPLTDKGIREGLAGFWEKALRIEPTRSGFALAVPQTFPDGWQMVVEIEDHLPSGIKLSDRGRTLEWLSAQGQNTDTHSMSRHLAAICAENELERDGLEIYRWYPRPVEGLDVHVFTEALASVARLHVLSFIAESGETSEELWESWAADNAACKCC